MHHLKMRFLSGRCLHPTAGRVHFVFAIDQPRQTHRDLYLENNLTRTFFTPDGHRG